MVVLEVGMGGRLDATNVVEPRLSIITDIALDHQKYLGETIARDCARKSWDHPAGRDRGYAAAIARSQRRDRKRNFGCWGSCCECRALCAAGVAEPVAQWPVAQWSGATVSAGCMRSDDYGRVAAGGATSAAQPGAGDRGGRGTARPGNRRRSRRRPSRKASARPIGRGASRWCRLRETILNMCSMSRTIRPGPGRCARRFRPLTDRDGREITMVFGVMRDKAVREITEILFPIARHVIVTHANNPRSATPDEIRQAAARVAAGMDIEEADNVTSALEQAREAIAGPQRPGRCYRFDLHCRRSDANAGRQHLSNVWRGHSCPRNVCRKKT